MNDQEKTSELAKFSNFSFFYLPASCTLPQVKRNVYGCSTKCTHCFRITTHTSSVKKEKKEHTVNGDQLNSGLRLQNSYLWLIQISVMNEASINPLTKTEGRSPYLRGYFLRPSCPSKVCRKHIPKCCKQLEHQTH